jgi:glycerol-3-phosphate dehydrogenase
MCIVMKRSEIINHYQNNPEVSALIIGAGINGIGTFRDLALQGVDVLMVDKGDFCSGASAASSHMVHGGIRYLENGEFRLVREAVQERNRLIESAPHYVKPLPTVIPIFKWFSGLLNAPLKFLGLLDKPSERGAVVIKTGLMLYDAFTRNQGTVPKHRFKPRAATLDEFPEINPKVLFTAHYYDGSMHTPERICAELLLDGEAANPEARALNYASVDQSSGSLVTLVDQVTGESFNVKPRVIVNAAGPWIDFVNAKLGMPTNFIGGTKGSHLIIDNPDLLAAIGENEFFFENDDGRIVLIFPLKNKVLIGTSDLPIENPDDARCTEDEIDYFIQMVRIVFPKIAVKREQIVFQFSGVRPLPASDSDRPGQISRDHSIEEINPGSGSVPPIYSLVGGKWTSFRAFSEEVTDKTLNVLNITRKTNTRGLGIGGGRGYPKNQAAQEAWIEQLSQVTNLPSKRVAELFQRYGTRAEQFSAFIAKEPDTPLHFLPGYSRREIEFIAKEEKVVHLDDLLLRRSMIAKLGQLTYANIDELSKIIYVALNWSPDRMDTEVRRVFAILRDQHGINF